MILFHRSEAKDKLVVEVSAEEQKTEAETNANDDAAGGESSLNEPQEKKSELVKKPAKTSKPVQKLSDADKAKRILQLNDELNTLKSDKIFVDSAPFFRPSDAELQSVLEDLQMVTRFACFFCICLKSYRADDGRREQEPSNEDETDPG